MAEITGTENDDTLTGTSQDDVIHGLGGNDTLDGSSGADRLLGGEGNDVLDGGSPFTGMFEHEFRPNILQGGPGDDIYFTNGYNLNDGARFQADTITDLVGEGHDVVFTRASYSLSSEIEELRLTSASSETPFSPHVGLFGNEFANAIYGNLGSQLINGGGGADQLYGMAGTDRLQGDAGDDLLVGGEGADSLDGGDGNDTFLADSTDFIIEQAGRGDDTVRIAAGGTFTLQDGASVETMGAIDPTSADAFNINGNEFGQSIYGTAGANRLAGRGGDDQLIGLGGDDILDGNSGVDVLRGGAGSDLYFVDDARDQVFEDIQGGDDRVLAAISYTLAAGVEVETLGTVDKFGTTAINLRGNELAQSIFGNDGNNFLDGRGGADRLVGRLGNDTFVVDQSGDVITELAGEGDDVLLASASYTLAGTVSVETMVAADGTSAIELRGNELGQSLYGNAGANWLDGRGRADFLVGGEGADLFAFTTAPGSGNVDAIGDMQSGVDRIGVDNAVFLGLDGGALPASAFVTGTSAQDADDRIIYDPSTGALFFDADGTGSGAAVQFASVTPGLVLSASDFVVI